MPRRLLNLFGEGPQGRVKLAGAAVVACISMVALGVTVVYRFDTAHQLRVQTVNNCQSIEQLKMAISDVFREGRARLRERQPELTLSEYLRMSDYYRRQLARFAPHQCPTLKGDP